MSKNKITLGIHIGHDRGAALIRNGILWYSVAQERVDRKKHSPSPEFPYAAIDRMLVDARLRIEDVDAIGISYTNVMIEKIIDQLADELSDHYQIRGMPILGVGHHLCHALSAFHTSDFESADIFIADGSGDIVGTMLEAESLYYADSYGTELTGRRTQDFAMTYPWRRNSFNYDYMSDTDKTKQISFGRKYEQMTYLIGFRHGDAGKTMGLAAYGNSLINASKYEFENLEFSLTYGDLLQELEGLRQVLSLAHHRFVQEYAADIAATGQAFLENSVAGLLRNLRSTARTDSLCLAGGVFMNCQLNYRIIRDSGWRSIHVIPAAGDDGQACGAAFHAYNLLFGISKCLSSPLPFLGLAGATKGEINEAVRGFGLPYRLLSADKLIRETARLLYDGYLIGILRGRSEMGPRALCHRSILADPRKRETRDKLNKAVKFRESFRPLAPVVTEEDHSRFFALPQRSPYMLIAAPVHPEFREALGAITHCDGTARVQTLAREKDVFMHRVLKEFEKLSSFPILLNTSFNLADEPIVETLHDALSTFVRSNLDALIVGDNYLITKPIKQEARNLTTDPKIPHNLPSL